MKPIKDHLQRDIFKYIVKSQLSDIQATQILKQPAPGYKKYM